MELASAIPESDTTDPYLRLQAIARKNGLVISDKCLGELRRFEYLLLDWNKKINLVSRANTGNVWNLHILHSLSLLFVLDIPPNLRVLDIGTGGGFPGIPMAIVRPDLSVTLLDSIRKKTRALEDIIGQLGLANVTVVTERAENLPRISRTKYDLIIARAVASLKDLVSWSRPLANRLQATKPAENEGQANRRLPVPALLALKGGDLTEEIALADRLTGVVSRTIPLVFSYSEDIPLEEKKLVVVPL